MKHEYLRFGGRGGYGKPTPSAAAHGADGQLVAPVPAISMLTVVAGIPTAGTVRLQLFDLQGPLVAEIVLKVGRDGWHTIPVDLQRIGHGSPNSDFLLAVSTRHEACRDRAIVIEAQVSADGHCISPVALAHRWSAALRNTR